MSLFFFFFNDTATTEIYTLSLHDALPISPVHLGCEAGELGYRGGRQLEPDRKSTRLNSSHANISYAVFCLKKKNTTIPTIDTVLIRDRVTGELPSLVGRTRLRRP